MKYQAFAYRTMADGYWGYWEDDIPPIMYVNCIIKLFWSHNNLMKASLDLDLACPETTKIISYNRLTHHDPSIRKKCSDAKVPYHR